MSKIAIAFTAVVMSMLTGCAAIERSEEFMRQEDERIAERRKVDPCYNPRGYTGFVVECPDVQSPATSARMGGVGAAATGLRF